MKHLNVLEKVYISLGAAIGSNCIPCIINHIAIARKNGISKEHIREAIEIAVKVRQVPANLVVSTAMAHLEDGAAKSEILQNETPDSCCEC